MLGEVLAYKSELGEGIILGEDTKRYSFSLRDWKSLDIEPSRGVKVDFLQNEREAKDIYVKENSFLSDVTHSDNVFMRYYVGVLKKYANFEGRARRAEYWYFTLFNWIIGLLLGVISAGTLSMVYSLVVLLPTLAVSVRRLHDTNRSGWWLLIWLIPLIGMIVFTIFAILDSDEGVNRFGANPKKFD